MAGCSLVAHWCHWLHPLVSYYIFLVSPWLIPVSPPWPRDSVFKVEGTTTVYPGTDSDRNSLFRNRFLAFNDHRFYSMDLRAMFTPRISLAVIDNGMSCPRANELDSLLIGSFGKCRILILQSRILTFENKLAQYCPSGHAARET